jgi:hypothetical protein
VRSEKSLSFVFVLLIIFLAASGATAKMSLDKGDDTSQRRWERSRPPAARDSGEEGNVQALGNLLQGVEIRSPLGDEFNIIYDRNRAEIHQLVDRNPEIIWDTLGLVLDLLPALRSADRNGGKLYVEKQLYARATDLYWKCESLASPGLARDLKRAKSLVESRMIELNSRQLVIDLNK